MISYQVKILQSRTLRDTTLYIPKEIYLLIAMAGTTTSALSEAFILAGVYITWIEHSTYPWFTQLLNALYQCSWEADDMVTAGIFTDSNMTNVKTNVIPLIKQHYISELVRRSNSTDVEVNAVMGRIVWKTI